MQIKPFKAYRFNPAVVGDTSGCFAPPYDVIDDAQRQRLYDQSEYNIVRITKGITTAEDNDRNNQYTRAAEYFADWIKRGILKQDDKETIYAYVQDFPDPRALNPADCKTLQRLSFIALAKLEEFGDVVKPHEQVLNAPIVDRLNLKKAIEAEPGLVFMLYDDKEGVAEKIIKDRIQETGDGRQNKLPLADFTDEQDVRHRIYAITDSSEINQIVQMMKDKSVVIADGHHRYTTALTYSKMSKNPAAGYQMLAFSDIRQNGLIVLATHRLVGNLPKFSIDDLIVGLKGDFNITKLAFKTPKTKSNAKNKMLVQMKAGFDSDKNTFGIYAGNNAFYVIELKDSRKSELNSELKTILDVAVLHKLILEKLLGIDEKAAAGGGFLKYVKDLHDAVDESIAEVDSAVKQVAFFLNPIKIEQLSIVTDAGRRMPQKSTFFYPKLFSGLTIQKL
jgi:uncharacterized protein (DUF1015 family)